MPGSSIRFREVPMRQAFGLADSRAFLAAVAVFAIVLATPSTAAAQIDVSGEWAATFHEDLPHRGGMRLGDYTGLPLNEAGIRKALAWDEDARSMRERQCVPHVVTYAM